ncbi:5-hydroxyisourate hydrolase [Hasllibacter halocynthiae]|uniref:5-hydroxyisourate hydrolase n=1 Tax=Hasllibacter halocynthiae TaxID=595589 RepID=A0A2T0XA05_9RHOB|nr:hydroxyisourate hydrolase [Hasllibacter halocynthiae]PRY95765.1 5-hydroxyisourate hydrolase [Hasllibacter halocynthiae]
MTRITTLLSGAALAALPFAAIAEGISTHVLDVTNGVGAGGVPVTLEMEGPDGWTEVASATTEDNGRANGLVEGEADEGLYRLTFDMTGYDGFSDVDPLFFPEISVSFRVDDGSQHYHVPIVVSPYNYSTYRGN